MNRQEIIDKWNGMTDRERDAWICKMRFPGARTATNEFRVMMVYMQTGERTQVPDYTSDSDIAFELFDELGEGYCLTRRVGENRWQMMNSQKRLRYHMDADGRVDIVKDDIQPTPQRAICLAYLLKKLEAEDKP